MVDDEAERRLTFTAGMQRAQEGVFEAEERGTGLGGHGLPAFGVGAFAPDGDQVVRAGAAELQGKARQGHDAANAGLAQEARVEIENPPRVCRGGWFRVRCGHQPPPSVSLAVETLPSTPSVPVRAEMTLLHCAKGASVT